MTRFFYADEAIPPAGGAPPNIAEIMARSGTKTDSETSVEIPNIITEEPIQSSAEVKPEAKVETAEVKETPNVQVEVPRPTNQPGAQVQAPPVDWKDQMKKADMAEVLKELGFDEKMVGFVNKWRTDGNIAEYLRAVTVDYSKMSPEQLLRQQLSEEYPEFSPEDFEELYRSKVVDHYKLDPDLYSEKEVKTGRVLISADAKKIREQLSKQQQEYILTAKPPAPPSANLELESHNKQQEEATRQVLEQYKTSLEAHPATKDLLANKRLVIGEGEDTFNYEVPDPTKALNILQDPGLWAQAVFEPDGSPQIEKQLFLSAAAIDYKGLSLQIFKAGKALGAKQAVEQIENAKKPEATTGHPEAPLTPAQALARNGVRTYDNF